MSTPTIDLLLITDLHYIHNAPNECFIGERKCTLGRTLLQKALLRCKHMDLHPDLIILLGDIVNDGLAERADEDLKEIADDLRASGIPFLALAGNHDGDMAAYADIMQTQPGFVEHKGYGFLLFNDLVAEGDVTTRRPADIALPEDISKAHPDLPLVALQHNPIYPDIDSAYPYMHTNGDALKQSYENSNVFLSISGHFHPGEDLVTHNGVQYHTAPALCEAPFRVEHIRLNGTTAEITQIPLQHSLPGLCDVHCHTEYAYCATTVSAEGNIECARAMGLSELYLTEHAFHLYYAHNDAGCCHWMTDQSMVQNAFANRDGRMDEYKAFVCALRDKYPDFVKIGLEVDLCADGSLLLADEDKDGWDILLGAVHSIPEFTTGVTSQEEAEELFLRDTRRILDTGIDVLAHPFRFFRRANLQQPTHLYATVAEMLAEAQIAAEINYHTNQPDPAFLRECLARDVKIVFGTDSHAIEEVGELYPHLEVLREAGATEQDFSRILLR